MNSEYYSSELDFLSTCYNVLNDKKPLDISKEKLLKLLSLLQNERYYFHKSDRLQFKLKRVFDNQQELLIEYHKLFNTLSPVNYKGLIIYFKVKCRTITTTTSKTTTTTTNNTNTTVTTTVTTTITTTPTIEDFSQENVHFYTIKDIEIFYRFTTLEDLRDTIYIIDNVIQLMDNINGFFIQEDDDDYGILKDKRYFVKNSRFREKIGIYYYTQEKTLTFLDLYIKCIEYYSELYDMEWEYSSSRLLFRYTVGDSFVKINLPIEDIKYKIKSLNNQDIYNIDSFIDILKSLNVTKKYKEIFKDFLDKNYSKYDKKWKNTKSSKNVMEQ